MDGNEEAISEACYARLINMDNSPEWGTALNVLIRCCLDGKCTEHLTALLENWMAVEVTEATNATRERDFPARQRINRMI